MHQQWMRDPKSVDQSWADHFSGNGQTAGADLSAIVKAIQQAGVVGQGGDLSQAQSEGFKVGTFIRAYMTHGHLQADVDPLELDKMEQLGSAMFQAPSEIMRDILSVENYGFTEADLDRTFFVDVPQNFEWGGLLAQK